MVVVVVAVAAVVAVVAETAVAVLPLMEMTNCGVIALNLLCHGVGDVAYFFVAQDGCCVSHRKEKHWWNLTAAFVPNSIAIS